jgi:hypothetical protein
MPRKKIDQNEKIQDAAPFQPELAYVTWSDDLVGKKEALQEASKGLDEFGLINKTVANNSRYRLDFSNLSPNSSGRPGLTRRDYDYFRPEESIPIYIKSIFQKAIVMYDRVGIVKNVIDLMADFASRGIRPVHPNKRIERFYRNWFDKVNGEDRSERFLNNLYKVGNVVINRQTAKISLRTEESLYKATGTADIILENEAKTEKREIPWKYTFIDPTYVDVIGGPLASFVGNRMYAITLPAGLRKIIMSPKTEAEAAILSQLPLQVLEAAKSKKEYLLDPAKTFVCHYKKDDWQTWAYPMVYAIMDDINIIEKLKLADLAALDGAISNIRIFKLGSLEHKIAPTAAAASKLSSILENNVGGGTMDLVWGPDIELIESKTTVHEFLGEAKYIPHLNSIYAGLGIPPTLTGAYGAAGTTNNFISLKTLTQRLDYGRKKLANFWKQEFVAVQKAMGFKYPAKLEFDRMDLSNEDTEKALLVQLADRNLVSDEMLQRIFGFDPEIERNRLNRESRDRDGGRMVRKSGPWYDPQIENSLKKIALQGGAVAPSQVGLELEKKKGGEKTSLELRSELAPAKTAPQSSTAPSIGPGSQPGQPGQGRPKTSKDSQQRKSRKFTPQTGASLHLWAMASQDKISEILNPVLLDFYNKKNMRSLSSIEYDEAERTKTKVFLSLEPMKNIDEDIILGKLSTINNPVVAEIYNEYSDWAKNISINLAKNLTSEEQKYNKAYFYSLVYNS